jgi:hypothetical protein
MPERRLFIGPQAEPAVMDEAVRMRTPQVGLVRRLLLRSAPAQATASHFTAVLSIPAGNVVAALDSLIQSNPRFAHHRRSSADPLVHRKDLMDVLTKLGFSAHRSPHDLGVDICQAKGTTEHVQAVIGALAPHARDGVSLELEGQAQRPARELG